MKGAKLDSNLDRVFGQGYANYITGKELVKQEIVTRLRCFKNDWFLDNDKYIDWVYFFNSKNSEERLRSVMKEVIEDVYGVIRVNSIVLSSKNRILTAEISITDIYDSNIYLKENLMDGKIYGV